MANHRVGRVIEKRRAHLLLTNESQVPRHVCERCELKVWRDLVVLHHMLQLPQHCQGCVRYSWVFSVTVVVPTFQRCLAL